MPMTQGAAFGHRRIREIFEISVDSCLKVLEKIARYARQG
jgi:hypothetical protein